jgi:hypothetical protein
VGTDAVCHFPGSCSTFSNSCLGTLPSLGYNAAITRKEDDEPAVGVIEERLEQVIREK